VPDKGEYFDLKIEKRGFQEFFQKDLKTD